MRPENPAPPWSRIVQRVLPVPGSRPGTSCLTLLAVYTHSDATVKPPNRLSSGLGNRGRIEPLGRGSLQELLNRRWSLGALPMVARVEEWPGVHCAVPLMTGAAVEGSWFDRTLEYNARLRGKELEKGESASRETVRLSPLPCWKHLAEEEYRARIADLVREINESGAAARAESQIPPLGPDGVRAQNPETRPKRMKKSPAPFCHALRKKVRKALCEAYGYFVAAYREAAEKLRGGDRNAEFPPGSFPPRLPFVTA